ncbi:MAG TPA: tetratricopeptide repeat protein [Tepidisphaeraceae bacterium]|nr:tetratricopeptide repeat protein [Tepidisphaeraceae bacterium]
MNCEQILQRAVESLKAGQYVRARDLYAQALSQQPHDPKLLLPLGILELQLGNPAAAIPLLRKAVDLCPTDARHQIGLGEALASVRRWKDAAEAYRQALKLNPNSPDVQFALGVALAAQGDVDGAMDAYRAAIALRPDFANALLNLGTCLHVRNELAQAEIAYRQALSARPDDARVLSSLAVLMQAKGQLDDAVSMLEKAIQIQPESASHRINLGGALCGLQKYEQAVIVLRKAVELDPNSCEAAYNLGNALQGIGQLQEAAQEFRRAIALKGNYADAYNNLGNVLKRLGDPGQALSAYESAIRSAPSSVAAYNNAGCLYRALSRLEEAEIVLHRGLAIDSNQSVLLNNLGNVLKDGGQIDAAIECFRRATQLNPNDPEPHGNLAYALSFQSDNPQMILDECRRWNERHAAPLLPRPATRKKDRSSGRRLRIGYASPDFRVHCQSLFTVPLLSHHDHEAFEIYCYSSVEQKDPLTARLKEMADVWRDVAHLNDAALCNLIQRDRIDILVDLTMHMSEGRPRLFARKPAPVQVAWLAYPGTTGMDAIDYRLTDPRLDPPGADRFYAERSIRLPDTFWCYDPLTDGPEVNALPALTNGYFTFGCLNNPCKLTDRTLSLFGRVLAALPGSRLLLLAPKGRPRDVLIKRIERNGIEAGRVSFVPFQPRSAYLQTYHQIDLGLDTLPYNGHTTSLDSCWMGVPVATRVGQTCAGRAGLSQLFNLGLTELAAESDDDYVKIASELGRDLDRLAQMRQTLRERLQLSPLMDADRFARRIEAAYQRMWNDGNA